VCAQPHEKQQQQQKNTLLSSPISQASHAKEPANWALVEDAAIVYSAGFFITVCPDAIAAVSEHCAKHNKVYAMNLSAPFISQVPPFKATLMATMPHIDVLFGNETEARAFAESEGWETPCLAAIAAKIAALPKANGTRGRTVVITQGADPTIVATEGRILTVPVTALAPEKLVDTNGAGDAFVGGFLSQLAAGKGPLECCRAGNFAAHFIIQRSGVTLPAEAPEFAWA
jgi:adenosine kinase